MLKQQRLCWPPHSLLEEASHSMIGEVPANGAWMQCQDLRGLSVCAKACEPTELAFADVVFAPGVTREDMLPYATAETQISASRGLGTVCVMGGKIAGVLVSQDWAEPQIHIDDDSGVENTLEKFEPIFEILDDLDARYKATLSRPIGKSTVLQQVMLAVDPCFRRCGIAGDLIVRNLQQGRDHGFTIAIMVATSRFSQAAAAKCGFAEVCRSAPYDTFVFGGGRPFFGIESATGHSYAALLVRPLVCDLVVAVGRSTVHCSFSGGPRAALMCSGPLLAPWSAVWRRK